MTAAVVILMALVAVGLLLELLGRVGFVESYTISTRDLPNVLAAKIDTNGREALPSPAEAGDRAAA